MAKSKGEIILAHHLKSHRIAFETEYRFHPVRRWRFDFAMPDKMLAVEIEGGLHQNGRHNRAAGYMADMEKYNAAVALGWRVLRFTPQQARTGEAVLQIAEFMGKKI